MNSEQRPTAADFMSEELEYDTEYDYYNDDLSDHSSDYNSESDLDFNPEESYDSFNSTKIFDMNEHFRSLEIKRLRLFIQGKYEMEEGEIITAFEAISNDEQIACELAVAYIKVLDGFKNCHNFDDVSNFVLDTADTLKLNSAQALNVHAILLAEKIKQTM
jgi:hypothetical protein